jgi:hypothetical protein
MGDYYPYAQVNSLPLPPISLSPSLSLFSSLICLSFQIPAAWWSGFFASRPQFKTNIRYCDALLQSVEQIAVATSLARNATVVTMIQENRRASGFMTHHDAVTGTSTPEVIANYQDMLRNSTQNSCDILNMVFGATVSPKYPFADEREISFGDKIDPIVSVSQIYRIYNPLAQFRTEEVSIAADGCMGVTDLVIGETVLSPYDTKASTDPVGGSGRLLWIASVPPLGFLSYSVSTVYLGGCSESTFDYFPDVTLHPIQGGITISNINLDVNFDSSGYLESVFHKGGAGIIQIRNDLRTYEGDRDGAYIFRPLSVRSSGNITSVTIQSGPIVSEVSVQFDSPFIAKQSFRILSDAAVPLDVSHPFESIVGSMIRVFTYTGTLPEGDEVTYRFDSSVVTSEGTFYTNANGVYDMKRTRSPPSHHPSAEDFFPTTHSITLRGVDSASISLAVDRSHAVASLSEGSFEAMIQRRTKTDDFPPAGLGESLNDTDAILDRSALYIGSNLADPTFFLRTVSILIHNNPLVMIPVSGDGSIGLMNQVSLSFLKAALPTPLRLLSLKINEFNTSQVVFRLHNVQDHTPITTNGTQVTFDPVCIRLDDVFSFGQVTHAEIWALSLLELIRVVLPSEKLCIGSNSIVTFLITMTQ